MSTIYTNTAHVPPISSDTVIMILIPSITASAIAIICLLIVISTIVLLKLKRNPSNARSGKSLLLYCFQYIMMLFLETSNETSYKQAHNNDDNGNKIYDNPFYGERDIYEHNLIQVNANPSYQIAHDLIKISDNQAYTPRTTNDYRANTVESHGAMHNGGFENSQSYSYITVTGNDKVNTPENIYN